MIIYVILVLALGLLLMAYIFKRPSLAFASLIAWIVLAVETYTLSTGAWDIYYGLFWLCILMIVISGLEGWTLRPKNKDETPEEKYWESDNKWDDYWKRTQSRQNRYDIRKRPRPTKQSDFAKTGKM